MKKKLPSGAELEITLAPFADAKNLQKAMAKDLKHIRVTSDMNLLDANFLKDIVLTVMSSDEIMKALEPCLKRCTYNGLKITDETFEPSEARQDYDVVCKEVIRENLAPFLKGLSSELGDALKSLAQLK